MRWAHRALLYVLAYGYRVVRNGSLTFFTAVIHGDFYMLVGLMPGERRASKAQADRTREQLMALEHFANGHGMRVRAEPGSVGHRCRQQWLRVLVALAIEHDPSNRALDFFAQLE